MVLKYTLEGKSTPTEWKTVGIVSNLYIYPVKSCKGVEVEYFNADCYGAKSEQICDRQFMIVDGKHQLVTARKYPHMVLIEVIIKDKCVTLNYPGMSEFKIQTSDHMLKIEQFSVFGESCQGYDMGDEVSKWLSDVIMNDEEANLRLVYHPPTTSSRPDKIQDLASPNIRPQDKPYFADVGPFMLLSHSSIEGLNEMLETENVDMTVEQKRFRPNIFISGDFPPFSEDSWSHIKIGQAVFRNVRPCDRCVFTSVDPEMGDKHPQQEPLKTLRKFRSAQHVDEKKIFGSSPFFGVLLASDIKGKVSVGDDVMIGAD